MQNVHQRGVTGSKNWKQVVAVEEYSEWQGAKAGSLLGVDSVRLGRMDPVLWVPEKKIPIHLLLVGHC